MDEKLKEQNYVEELIEIIRSTKSNEELRDKLSDYHENDIADAFVRLDEEERKRLYSMNWIWIKRHGLFPTWIPMMR